MSELKGSCIEQEEEAGREDCELRLVLREEPEGHFVLFADLGEAGLSEMKRRRRYKPLGVFIPDTTKEGVLSREAYLWRSIANIVKKRKALITEYLMGSAYPEEEGSDHDNEK